MRRLTRTVPGQRWQCGDCGYVGIYPATYNVTGVHAGCPHKATLTDVHPESGIPLVPSEGLHPPEMSNIRAAQPKPPRGEKATYDAYAKKVMYLAATSWLKSGPKSFYQRVYRDKVAYYERERPGWSKGRRHYSALRVAEKLFLSHLYEAWSKAIGREPVECYASKHLNHDGISTPEEVLEWEARASQAA